MNKERGIIKWLPFNSINLQGKMVENLLVEKAKILKPELSEEQKKDIQEKLIEAYYEKINISIDYYSNGFIKQVNAKINYIDYTNKKIFLSNHVQLLIKQIIHVMI